MKTGDAGHGALLETLKLKFSLLGFFSIILVALPLYVRTEDSPKMPVKEPKSHVDRRQVAPQGDTGYFSVQNNCNATVNFW